MPLSTYAFPSHTLRIPCALIHAGHLEGKPQPGAIDIGLPQPGAIDIGLPQPGAIGIGLPQPSPLPTKQSCFSIPAACLVPCVRDKYRGPGFVLRKWGRSACAFGLGLCPSSLFGLQRTSDSCAGFPGALGPRDGRRQELAARVLMLQQGRWGVDEPTERVVGYMHRRALELLLVAAMLLARVRLPL
eukprot:scaffold139650_cov18-Tisochrysis_lutea.AAC.2